MDSREVRWGQTVVELNDGMTATELQAIDDVLRFRATAKKNRFSNRSGTTIGTGVPRTSGKDSNADLSKRS